MSLATALAGKRVIICCGSGGVGKTTISASVALEHALAGKRTVVCTIDPARRLANSLGLDRLDNEPRPVPSEAFAAANLDVAGGELHALMLDTKRTFDALVERYAPSPEVRDTVLANRMYQNISSALAGSHEYMAMEKLYELTQSGDYDVLVLDTPPTTFALDFLEAPTRINHFVASDVLDKFLRPYFRLGHFGYKMVQKGMGRAFQVLEKLTGLEVLRDIADFFDAFDALFDGFRERADRVAELIRSPDSVFLLVTGPRPDTLAEGIFFYERLAELEMPFGGFVVNMVHEPFDHGKRISTAVERLRTNPKSTKPDSAPGVQLLKALAQTYRDHEALAERESLYLDDLKSRVGRRSLPIFRVPFFDDDVHDLAGLKTVADRLFRPEP